MNPTKIIVNNGFLIYIGIVLFFFLMKILNLDEAAELRFLNFIFVLWGVNKAIKMNITLNKETSYIDNLSVGIGTSIFAVGLTILGLIVYINFINPDFMKVLENSFLWGKQLTLPLMVFALAIEGIASSVICSFILMQYYKNYKLPDVIF